MFRLKIPAKANRDLKLIKNRYQHAISVALEEIKEDPTIGKPLERKLTGRFTYRVGVYRIIYTINKKDKIVTLLFAGHRAMVYQ